MKVAMAGNKIPIKNHLKGLRPIRLAKEAVIKGRLNMTVKPNIINMAAPIAFF